MTAKFSIIPSNEKIWNESEFVDFLIANQGQPIELDTNREGPDLTACGVYRLLDQFNYSDVTIITNNPLETHGRYTIKTSSPFFFFDVQSKDYTQYHTWNQQKVFGCFYNRPLWHRIGLAAKLQTDYEQLSLINVRCNPQDVDQRSLFEVNTLFENDPASVERFISVADSWPIQIEKNDGYTLGNNTTGHTDQLVKFYPDFLIDIVGETWINGRTFYPTEKTVRPMLLKKPMIVMGSVSSLDYLHQMGFQTFCNFWSEEYDGYEGKERYIRILALIDELAAKSKEELADLYQQMQPVLEHNYQLLQAKTYRKQVEYIE